MTPFMYSFSMVGDTPKLFPIYRTSVLPSGYVTSTEPFKITDQESSCNNYTKTQQLRGLKEQERSTGETTKGKYKRNTIILTI